MKTILKLTALVLMSLIILPLGLTSCNILPSEGADTTKPSSDPTGPVDNGTTEEPTGETTAEPSGTTADQKETSSNETTVAETTAAVNNYSAKTYKVANTLDNIKIIGRSVTASNGVSVCWPGSGMEFNADCKGEIKVKMVSSAASGNIFACYVDGEFVKNIKPSSTGKTFTIAENLEKGIHSVRIVKCTQAYSTETLMSITVNGIIAEKPADKKLFVEFIGDSITAGFGLDDSSVEGAPVYNTTRSWAYLASEENGFDYSIVAMGGIGVAASTETHGGKTMTDRYPYTLYGSTKEYTTERKADFVVIALNTNDNGRTANFTKDEYRAKVNTLISQVKAVHGEDVKIIWVSALMFSSGTCDTYVAELFAELGGEAAGYYHTTNPSPDHSGFNSHPSISGQKNNAGFLKIYLRTKGFISYRK